MELRTLRYFTTIADTGTVSAAAQSLHVTQPGLSRQVRQLEKELGVELFDRTHGRLTLSGAGRAPLPHIRAVLAQAESVTVTAGVLARGSLESVTISAPSTTLTEVIAPVHRRAAVGRSHAVGLHLGRAGGARSVTAGCGSRDHQRASG